MTDATDEFTAFVAARQQALGRMAFLLTGEHHEAEDLVQIALAKAYLGWDRIHRQDSIEAYVRRTIINEHKSWWRRAWRRREHTTDVLPESAARSPDLADRDADRDEMWQAIRSLPPKQRAVIVLRYYEDLTEAETARVLGVAVGTVKSQTSRAFAKLRSLITQQNQATALAAKEEFGS